MRIDGDRVGTHVVPVGQDTTIAIPVGHGGENVVEVEARPGPSELTLQNNRAVVDHVRRARPLARIAGFGRAACGRAGLAQSAKADPSVDLVHFTILRPPAKQDATPIDELSLIAFPTRELFPEKLDGFDLVIFDRYSEHGILPLALLREHRGLCREWRRTAWSSVGPEFART